MDYLLSLSGFFGNKINTQIYFEYLPSELLDIIISYLYDNQGLSSMYNLYPGIFTEIFWINKSKEIGQLLTPSVSENIGKIIYDKINKSMLVYSKIFNHIIKRNKEESKPMQSPTGRIENSPFTSIFIRGDDVLLPLKLTKLNFESIYDFIYSTTMRKGAYELQFYYKLPKIKINLYVYGFNIINGKREGILTPFWDLEFKLTTNEVISIYLDAIINQFINL